MSTLIIILALLALVAAPRFADDADPPAEPDPSPDEGDELIDEDPDAEDAPGEGDDEPPGEGDDEGDEIDFDEDDPTKDASDAFAMLTDPAVKAEAQKLHQDLQSLTPLEQAQVYSIALNAIRQQQAGGKQTNGKQAESDPDAGKKAQAVKAAKKAQDEGVDALSEEDREILRWAKQERARRQQEQQQEQTKQQRAQFQSTLTNVLDEAKVTDEDRRQELIEQFTGHVTFHGAESNVASQFRRWLKGRRRGPSANYLRKKQDDARRTRGEAGGSRTAAKKIEEFSVDDFERGDFSKVIDSLT